MSGTNAWLVRQRKSDLVDLAELVGLKGYVYSPSPDSSIAGRIGRDASRAPRRVSLLCANLGETSPPSQRTQANAPFLFSTATKARRKPISKSLWTTISPTTPISSLANPSSSPTTTVAPRPRGRPPRRTPRPRTTASSSSSDALRELPRRFLRLSKFSLSP